MARQKKEEALLQSLRSVQEITMLVFSVSVSVAIGVFALIRVISGEYGFAVHNLIISLLALLLFFRVWVYKDIRQTGLLISSLCVVGATTVVYVGGGVEHFYWAYPGFLAPFFMTNTRNAAILCALGCLFALPKFWLAAEPLMFSRALTALFVNLIFGVTFSVANNIYRNNLEIKVKTDGLTGVANRRALDDALQTLILQRRVPSKEYYVLMMDLDHFKAVNDRFGHAEGDHVLIEFADHVDHHIKGLGTVYRYGGEEFTVIAETDRAGAVELAERLRASVEVLKILAGHTVTVSIGIALLRATDSAESVLSRADEALLTAKSLGRNRVIEGVDNFSENSVKVVA